MKEKNPLFSIVINCFNSEEYLKKAVESVIKQTYKNWEIIFWDNASTDNSSKIIKSFKDSRIKYFRGEKTVLIYSARNYALKKCNGELVTFLDCDDIWLDNKLEDQKNLYLEGNEIVYGGYKIINKKGEETGKIHNDKKTFNTYDLLLYRRTISIGSVMVTKDIMTENLFDERYQLMGDFELWFRLSLKYKFYNSGNIVELSRQHGKNISQVSKNDLWDNERRMFYLDFFKHASIFKYPQIFIYIFLSVIQRIFLKKV